MTESQALQTLYTELGRRIEAAKAAGHDGPLEQQPSDGQTAYLRANETGRVMGTSTHDAAKRIASGTARLATAQEIITWLQSTQLPPNGAARHA